VAGIECNIRNLEGDAENEARALAYLAICCLMPWSISIDIYCIKIICSKLLELYLQWWQGGEEERLRIEGLSWHRQGSFDGGTETRLRFQDDDKVILYQQVLDTKYPPYNKCHLKLYSMDLTHNWMPPPTRNDWEWVVYLFQLFPLVNSQLHIISEL